MRLRLIGSMLVAAFAVTIGLAAAPAVHEHIHGAAADHECAVTIVASGKYEYVDGDIAEIFARLMLPSPAVLPRHKRPVIAHVGTFVLEHAPPAHS